MKKVAMKECALLIFVGLMGCGPAPIDAVGLAPATPASGPIAHWSFDQREGTILADDSGNRRVGTIAGATFVSDGRFGGALHFQPGNSVTVENFPDPTPSWTFSAWIRISNEDAAVDALGTAVSTEDHQKGGWEFQTYGRSSGVLWHFGYWVDAPWKYVRYERRGFETGRWAHATIVRDADANALNFYADAVLEETIPSPPLILPGTPTLLMGKWEGVARLFAGSLDDIAIYQRALSAAEVAELHQKPPARPQ
jgi:hypothetical protein